MASRMQRERPIAPMAPPPPPPPPSKDVSKLTISNLMSPPDPIIDSFNPTTNNAVNGSNVAGKAPSEHDPLLMSPPISPYSKPIQPAANANTHPNHTVQDPLLYPVDESSPASPPQPPLFAPVEIEQHRQLMDTHVRRHSSEVLGNVLPPKRKEFELTLRFKSQVLKLYSVNPKDWLRRERGFLEADRTAARSRYHTILPVRPILAPKPVRPRAPRQNAAAPRPARNSVGSWTSGGAVAKPAKRTSATPEPLRRPVAPNREDKDFNSLPDYCPPTNGLDEYPKGLKVDWKGQPLFLDEDAHAHLLHPDELLLASNLRLDCATYLTSKRRIFDRRLQCLRMGKEFRKTDAQQACKIDVNKASKLWTAFQKVGWLEPVWMRRFL